MTNANFTQGEWFARDFSIRVEPTKKLLCTMYIGDYYLAKDVPTKELNANANLISASPDMYKALKLFLERMDETEESGKPLPMNLELPRVLALRALNKADGK